METNLQIQPEIQLCRNTVSYREEYVKISFPLKKHYSPKERIAITRFLMQKRSFPKEVDMYIHEKIRIIYEVLRNYKTYEPPQCYYSICPQGNTEKQH